MLQYSVQYSLFNFDAPQLRDSSRNDIRNGDAAEAFALAKLLKWGFDAHDERSLPPVDFSSMLSHGPFIGTRAGC